MTTPSQSTESHLPQTLKQQLRPRKLWDVALSIVLVVLANAAFLIGAIFGVFAIAFIDYCPRGCDANTGVSIQFIAGAILALVGLIGSVLTIVLLVRRRRAWWVALATLVLIVVGWVADFVVFAFVLNYH